MSSSRPPSNNPTPAGSRTSPGSPQHVHPDGLSFRRQHTFSDSGMTLPLAASDREPSLVFMQRLPPLPATGGTEGEGGGLLAMVGGMAADSLSEGAAAVEAAVEAGGLRPEAAVATGAAGSLEGEGKVSVAEEAVMGAGSPTRVGDAAGAPSSAAEEAGNIVDAPGLTAAADALASAAPSAGVPPLPCRAASVPVSPGVDKKGEPWGGISIVSPKALLSWVTWGLNSWPLLLDFRLTSLPVTLFLPLAKHGQFLYPPLPRRRILLYSCPRGVVLSLLSDPPSAPPIPRSAPGELSAHEIRISYDDLTSGRSSLSPGGDSSALENEGQYDEDSSRQYGDGGGGSILENEEAQLLGAREGEGDDSGGGDSASLLGDDGQYDGGDGRQYDGGDDDRQYCEGGSPMQWQEVTMASRVSEAEYESGLGEEEEEEEEDAPRSVAGEFLRVR